MSQSIDRLRTGKFHLNGHCTGEQLRDEAIYFGIDRLVEDLTVAAAGAAARSDDTARNDIDARRQILIIEVKGGTLCG